MTLAERIFWWLAAAYFTWFVAFPAHAALEQTADPSGYAIDEPDYSWIFDPNAVPTSQWFSEK